VVTATMNPTAATRQWQAATGTGLLRIGAGLALLRWRDPLIRASGGSPSDRVVRGVFTYFAARDIAVGVSALLSTRPGADVSRQVAAQGVADAGDTAIVVALVRSGRLRPMQGAGAAALAALTAAVNFTTSWRLHRD